MAKAGRPSAKAARRGVPAGQGDRLIDLFLSASPHRCAHWNVLTGETFELESRRDAESRLEAFELRLFEEDGWVEVPWPDSDEDFRVAEAFLEELEPGREQAELRAALEGPKPFRAFRDALRRWPESAEAWRERQREAAGWRVAEVALAFDAKVDDTVITDMIARLRTSDAEAEAAEGAPGGESSTEGDSAAGIDGPGRLGVARMAAAELSLGRRRAE